MSQDKALVTRADRMELFISMPEWTLLREQCAVLVKSGFLPKAIDTPEKAVAIALKGRELGVPPMQSFAQINVIQGKPCISAELMLALILRNVPGAKVEIERYEADGCTLVATRPGNRPARFAFDLKDAKSADLLGKDNWRKYPRAMYRSRAISEMARSVFPDAIMGCSYTPEEMGALVDEHGEVIDIEAREPAAKAEPEQQQKPPENNRGPTYDGSEEHEQGLHAALKGKVPEDLWPEIHRRMMGKYKDELRDVVKQVRDDWKAQPMTTPAEASAAAADKNLAIAEFERALAGVRKVGGDAETILGRRINDVLLSGDPKVIQAAADALTLWQPPST